MSNNKMLLGYWGSLGKAQPIRYLLEIAGVEYEEKRYTDPNEWFGKDKYSLGLAFPNLPYLIDGDSKVTESETIFDYLINKLNKTELLGKDEDKFIVDMLRNTLNDVSFRLYLFTLKQGEEQTKYMNEQILPKFRDVHKYLGNKEYLLGYFTAADLYFLATFVAFKRHFADLYKEFASTFDPFLERLQAIPQIAKYIKDGRHP